VTRPATQLIVVLVAAVLTAGACAETVVELDTAESVDDTGAEVTAASTTLPVAGSAAELLPEMATEMSVLGGQIAEDGDEKATLARIDQIWVVARPEVESTRPELVGGIDTTVEMARTAVVRIRPADADKAFSILTDLVDRYTGDG